MHDDPLDLCSMREHEIGDRASMSGIEEHEASVVASVLDVGEGQAEDASELRRHRDPCNIGGRARDRDDDVRYLVRSDALDRSAAVDPDVHFTVPYSDDGR